MKRIFLLLVGGIFIALLSFICFKNKLKPITDGLINQTIQKLNKNGIYDINVSIVGKGYKTKLFTKLEGSVVSKKAKQKAIMIARSVDGVFGVEENITIQKPKILSKKLVFEPVDINSTTNIPKDNNLTKKPLDVDVIISSNKREDNLGIFKQEDDFDDLDLIQDNEKNQNMQQDKQDNKSVENCQIRLNKLLAISKINFESNKSEIKKNSIKLLKRIAKIIKECKNNIKKIVIEGYTDNSGSEKANLILSQERAEAVKQYLIDNIGLKESQIKAIGYGESMPIADNKTKEGRSRNRRIEFKIIGDNR